MTRQSMLAAAKKLPRSPIYGVGICRSGDDFVDFEIGWDDYERATEWALAQLREAGVSSSDHVLITSPNHEAQWTSPVITALREIGATYTPAETYNWDAVRFVSVLERLPITVVFGVGSETLDAVAMQHPDLAKLFRGVRMIWARPDAYPTLLKAKVPAAQMAFIGPALGLAQPDSPDDLRVNGSEWLVEEDGSELVVSSAPGRSVPVSRVRTGQPGRVTASGDQTTIRI